MKVSVTTLGCKSNQYDSSALEDALRDESLELVPFPGPADAIVINTCTVTSKTDFQSRQLIRRARKLNPGAVVIVTGCYAEVSGEDIKKIPGVDYIVGNSGKAGIAEYIKRGRAPEGPVVGPTAGQEGVPGAGTPFTLRARSASGRTRANLKVQEGCDRRCSYCIIPRARGASKSLALDLVEREMDALVEAGYKEVVLTGIHLGAWGADLGVRAGITEILRLIEKKNYPCRVRLSSLDPDEVTDDLVEILGSANSVCRHLHLPLQSGDDGIIRRMNRPYTGAEFAEKVLMAARLVPGISVGVDVIAGFPGEGEGEFENTYSLLDDLPISYLHVFPYSKRKDTPAASFKDQVDPRVVKARCKRLKALDTEKRRGFFRDSVGKTGVVLVESAVDKATGLPKGRTGNYIPVLIEGARPEDRNTFLKVRLTEYDDIRMRGPVEKAFFKYPYNPGSENS